MTAAPENSAKTPELPSEFSPGVVAPLRALTETCSVIVLAVGGGVLAGWALDSALLIALAPRFVAMNPATALAFVLAGASLWLQASSAGGFLDKLWRRRLAQGLALGAALLGLFRLSEIFFGWPSGVDQLLFREKLAAAPGGWPNRMAPNTALNFLLVGAALLGLDVETRRGRRPAQFLVLGSGLVGFLALVGYSYGASTFYRLPLFIPMALNTAVAFLVVSLGVLCARPDRGLMIPVASDSAGGRLARWLLPAAVAVPVLLGWARWRGQESGLYGTPIGISLYTTSMVVVLVLLVWRSAFHLDRADAERRRAEEEVKRLNQDLERRVEQRTAELRLTESKFRGLLEMAPDAILTVDQSGRIVLANAEAEKLFGYPREELLGQSIELLVPERFREKHRSQCEAYFAEPQARTMQAGVELCARRQDGSEFPAEMTLSALETEQGVLVTSIVRNLTARQRAEATLRASERRFRDLVESAPDALVGVDGAGRILLVNLQTEKLFGYDREELLGQPLEVLLPARFRERHVGHRADYFSDPRTRPMGACLPLCARRKDGSEFPVDISLSPIETQEGTVVVSVIRDITERKRTEQEINRLFTLSLDLLCVAGFDGYFKRLNSTWEKVLGFTTAELLERPYLDFIHPDDREKTTAEAAKLSQGGTVISFENRYRCKDGSYRWLQWTAYPIPAETLIYAAARDVTSQKEADERIRHINAELAARSAELTVTNQELQAANKELEAFTYSVSHDLRAPLRHIDGFSRLLLEEHSGELSEQAGRYLQRVREGTQNMGRLVDDLLNLARVARQEPRRQVTGLNSLVEEARRELQPDCEKRQVEWRIGALPFVECDPALMKQVFSNLLSNALKYTRPRERAVIEVEATTENGQPAVFVRDNGVGFSMKYADKLFGVFQRLHRAEDFEGTGVGLATVQRIIHKHGGRVWAEAELDKGATFYLTLQTAPAAPAASRDGGEKPQGALGGGD